MITETQCDFSKMVAFDFNSLTKASSSGNCFGCDCNCDGGTCDCNCDCNDCDCDCNNYCDGCDEVPDYEPKKETVVSLKKFVAINECKNHMLEQGIITHIH